MSEREADPFAPRLGFAGFWYGVKIVFVLYLLVVVLRVVGPALGVSAVASEAGPYRSDAQELVLVVIAISLLVLAILGAFYAVFVYVSVHTVPIVAHSEIELTPYAGTFLPESGYTTSGTLSIDPTLFLPGEFAGVLYLLPPALLVVFGVSLGTTTDNPLGAIASLIAGYAIGAAIITVAALWLFNNFVAAILADFNTSGAAEATVAVAIPDPLTAVVVIGIGYPLIFGGVGILVGSALADMG